MVAITGKAVPAQRKRVLDALNLVEPDRVPVGMWGTFQGYQNLRRGLGMDYKEDLFEYRTGSTTWTTDVSFEVDVAERLDLDFIRMCYGVPGGSPGFRKIAESDVPFPLEIKNPGEIFTDEWGVIRKWTAHENGGYYEMIGYPLQHATSLPLEEGLKIIENYPWLNPRDEACVMDSPMAGMTLPEYAKYIKTETPYAILAQGGRGGIFEQAKYMLGYAKIFSDFIEVPELIEALLTKLTDIEIEFNKGLIDACGEHIDWIRMSPEDLASEKTSFMSAKMFKKQLLPHYVRAITEVKKYFLKKNPNGKIQFHSCGALGAPFLGGLIDGDPNSGVGGIDVFDSMPPKVARQNNPAAQKRRFGDRITFYGGIDVQETLPWGTTEEVRAEVRARIWEMGHGGGYILSSSHRLEHDVPVENTIAMREEAKEYGVYPLPEQPPEGVDLGEGLEE